MAGFYGQDKCLIDANGRVKLSARFEQDFRAAGALEIALHCLFPEGALAIYPLPIWEQMRAEEARTAGRAASSYVARQQLRRGGAMTQVETLSNQGRITIPSGFRAMLKLEPGAEAIVVGCEIGIEIWNAEQWQAEMEKLRAHDTECAAMEVKAAITAAGQPPPLRPLPT